MSFKKKNQLLLAFVLIMLLLSWLFAFQHTVEIIRLNGSLKDQIAISASPTAGPVYTSEKLRAINTAYDLFRADSAGWRNELWLRISDMASADKYQLVYSSDEFKSIKTDSLILSQNILLRAKFRDLIQLLDSAENIRGIGYISSLKIIKPERTSLELNPDLINMEIQFRAVPRSYIH